YTVIVDVLAIGHVRHLRIAANAKGAAGARLDEGHFNLLVLELRLAETAAEQFGGDVAILLADPHLDALVLAMDDTAFGKHLAGQTQQPQQPHQCAHFVLPANGDDSTPNRLSLNSRNAHHGAMLNDIPTHLIAGPLGAGKTSLIRALLAQKAAGERWAVLINEFGQIGLDAALLHRDEERK